MVAALVILEQMSSEQMMAAMDQIGKKRERRSHSMLNLSSSSYISLSDNSNVAFKEETWMVENKLSPIHPTQYSADHKTKWPGVRHVEQSNQQLLHE